MGRDVNGWLSENYSDLLKTVTELSKNDKGDSLVIHESQLFDFDKITEQIFPKNKPESADGICVCGKRIIFTEFKSGFVKKINKSNYDEHRVKCPDDQSKTCELYTKLFFKEQEKENQLLKNSLYLKGIESYITLTRHIMPVCKDDGVEKEPRLVYCVVIDDPVEVGEAIQLELARKTEHSNQVVSVKQSLHRLKKNAQKDYYYDELEVFTPNSYKQYLDKYNH